MAALSHAIELAPLLEQQDIQQGPCFAEAGRGWCLQTLRGRLVEISNAGTMAALTATTALLYEAQRNGEPVAWISTSNACFFPADVANSGVDLAALPVVRVAGMHSGARAADELLRSGAFGVVVLDLGTKHQLPMPMQARLGGLVKKHDATLVFLTRKARQAPSLGSLVSLRCDGVRWRSAAHRFTWELHIMKDKRQGPGWKHAEVCHGPDGLC